MYKPSVGMCYLWQMHDYLDLPIASFKGTLLCLIVYNKKGTSNINCKYLTNNLKKLLKLISLAISSLNQVKINNFL